MPGNRQGSNAAAVRMADGRLFVAGASIALWTCTTLPGDTPWLTLLIMTMHVQGKRGSRIRQGSPQEEAALASHIVQLAPSPQRTAEAGHLAEALVLFGKVAAAAQVQQSLSSLITEQATAAAWVAAHPPAAQPEPTSQAKERRTDEQGEWKWAVLREKAGCAVHDGLQVSADQSHDSGGVNIPTIGRG